MANTFHGRQRRVIGARGLVVWAAEHAQRLSEKRGNFIEATFWGALVEIIESKYPDLQDKWDHSLCVREIHHMQRFYEGLE